MTVPKRQASWRDLRAQANRLQSLERLLAQAHANLEHLIESHAIEKQQWLQKLNQLEINLQAMQQAEQDVSASVQQIEHQRQAAWNEAEARGLRINELEAEIAQLHGQLHHQRTEPSRHPQPTAEHHQQELQELQIQLQQTQAQLEQQSHKTKLLIEGRDQQIAVLQAQLAESLHPEPIRKPEEPGAPSRSASLLHPPTWLAWIRQRRLHASRPVQIALVAGLLVGLGAGMHQLRTRGSASDSSYRSSQSAALSSDAALLIRSSGPSWLEVRDLMDNSLYVGTVIGEQRFALGKGLKVLAGRPDLVTVQVTGAEPRVLGKVEDVGWTTFTPGQGLNTDPAPPPLTRP